MIRLEDEIDLINDLRERGFIAKEVADLLGVKPLTTYNSRLKKIKRGGTTEQDIEPLTDDRRAMLMSIEPPERKPNDYTLPLREKVALVCAKSQQKVFPCP